MRAGGATHKSLLWMGRKKWFKGRSMCRVLLLFSAIFLGVLIIGLLPFLLTQDANAFGRFPKGAHIGGVDVGGMTREEAIARCRTGLAGVEAEPLTLNLGDESISASPADTGLCIDYEKMVGEAYARSWNVNIVERMVRRFLKKPKSMNMPVIFGYDEGKLSAFLKSAMASINCKPRNCYLEVASGAAVIVPPRDGREAKYEDVLGAIKNAIDAGKRTVDVPLVKRTPAKVKSIDIGEFILVNLGDHTLSLYNRDQLIAQYPVCTGSKQWPTCIGEWAVVKAEKNPIWYNRGSTWAENMPDSIGPGPNNPLGTRAITINGGGVLIHGTEDTGSIGESASHGCIRMYMQDVEAVFEHVFYMMPVYIIKSSGEPGYDTTVPPFWKNE